MTTYKTGNPIGSADPKDLYDNAENLDVATNDRTKKTWRDRFNFERLTWAGIIAAGTGDASIAVEASESALASKSEAIQAKDAAISASVSASGHASNSMFYSQESERHANAASIAAATSSGIWRPTLTSLQNVTNQPVNTIGVVYASANPSLNGWYVWDGSSWNKTDLQPAQKRDFGEFNPIAKTVDDLDSIIENGIYRTIEPWAPYTQTITVNHYQEGVNGRRYQVAFKGLGNKSVSIYYRYFQPSSQSWGEWLELANKNMIDNVVASYPSLDANYFDPVNFQRSGDEIKAYTRSTDGLYRPGLVDPENVLVSTNISSGRNIVIDPDEFIATRALTALFVESSLFELRTEFTSAGVSPNIEIGLQVFDGTRVFKEELVLFSSTGLSGDQSFTFPFTRFINLVENENIRLIRERSAAYVAPFIRTSGSGDRVHLRFLKIRPYEEKVDPLENIGSNSSALFEFKDAKGNTFAQIENDGSYTYGKNNLNLSGLFSSASVGNQRLPIPRYAVMTEPFQNCLSNLRTWFGSNTLPPVPIGQVAEKWDFDQQSFLNMKIDYSKVSTIPVDTPYFENDQVVHPFSIQFFGSLLDQKEIVALTPYRNTNHLYENTFLYGFDGNSLNLLNGPPQPLGVQQSSPSVNYNSDPFSYYDFHEGKLVFVWRNGGTSSGFKLLARNTVDGVHWSNTYEFHPNVKPGLLLSPCVLYLPEMDKYIMYAAMEDSSFSGRKLAYRFFDSDLNYEPWVFVDTNLPDIWHLEIKRLGSVFVAVVNDNYATRNLYLGYSEDAINWTFNPEPVLINGAEPAYKATIRIQHMPSGQVKLGLLWTTSDRGSLDNDDKWRLKHADLGVLDINRS